MNKTSTYVRTICEIGIFAAIGFVLDELQGILSKGLFINGGSIGFAMLAVIVIGYRRGWLPAILTGLIMGLFDIATSAYIIHPAQLFLDYLLPYALVGVGCLFKILFDKAETKPKKIVWLLIGVLVGGLCKLLSHYLAGIFFWADPNYFAWGLNSMSPYLYCFIYNFAFIGPSIVLTGALAAVILWRAPVIFIPKANDSTENNNKIEYYPIISTSIISAMGLFCFIWFLIDYIKSFYIEKGDGTIDYSFNSDSMVIFILAFFMIILGVLSFIKIFKKRYSPLFCANVLLIIMSSNLIYGIARLIRMYVKEKDPTIYWIWFGVGLFTVLVCVGLSVYFYIKKKKTISTTESA